ncbi:MAG TPA: phytoene/squalene synthase family protein [Pirellulales bacterium]|jgi:phytoene synthase|nr:phytoene/squalene synthase family protein [Pirellulales bacterium]
MKFELASSYAHCQRIARTSGSSFYYSFLLLPKRQRLAMCALYAFLRRTDDLGDSLEPVERRRQALAAWRRSFEAAMTGRADDPLLPALADTVKSFHIPREHLAAAIDGVEMDLDVRRYETFDELQNYCDRVASAVGWACLCVWGCYRTEARRPARQCGLAFQMTNILRDLKEDAARDRVYLPREDLDRFDYSDAELLDGVCDERFRRLMRFEIERTERLYAEAAELEHWLDGDGRRVFGSMMAMYRALLAEIKRLDGDVLSMRVRLGGWRKMRIAARWFLLRPPLPRAAAGVSLP